MLSLYYPEHEPRKGDTHYALFDAARRRLERLGKLVCWRCGAKEHIELHHDRVEFSLANGIDIHKFGHRYPELHVESDEDFMKFVESEGNLMPLCVRCHRGNEGIHCILYSPWIAGADWRDGLPAPALVVREG